MPEGYAHVRTAKRAAEALHIALQYPAAFALGANGPDALFCYEVWKPAKKRLYDIPGLGGRMHEEKTGLFLQNLIAGVTTRAQLEYALGFVSHYAVDTVVHPYVCALCEPGMPYAGRGGHGYFEIALDSTLHEADTGSAAVPAGDTSPLMVGEELAEVCTQLHAALLATYGEDVPVEYLADAFHQLTVLRRHFTSRHGIKRRLAGVAERFIGGKGFITGHISPQKLKQDLPDVWTQPFTKAPMTGDAFTLLQEGQKRSEVYMTALLGCKMGKLSTERLAELLGSMSYLQGIPTAASAEGAATADPAKVDLPPEPDEKPAPEPKLQAEQKND